METVYLQRKDSFLLPSVIRHMLCVTCDFFPHSLISDLSLSSAHWRWGLHLSTCWAPICFRISSDLDILLVTNLTDMVTRAFCYLLQPVADCNSLISREKWAGLRCAAQTLSHGRVQMPELWLCRIVHLSVQLTAYQGPVNVHVFSSMWTLPVLWSGPYFQKCFEARNSNWEKQKLLGGQKEWLLPYLLTGNWATLEIWSKPKWNQNICYYLLRYDC